MVFWEFSFFHQKCQKVGCFWNISNQSFVFFWKHFIVVSCLGSVGKYTKHVSKDFSQEKPSYCHFWWKKENSQKTISAKKSLKRTVRIQPSKTLAATSKKTLTSLWLLLYRQDRIGWTVLKLLQYDLNPKWDIFNTHFRIAIFDVISRMEQGLSNECYE